MDDKEAKKKMMEEMLADISMEFRNNLLINEICDRLIRKGWRKIK
jgi:hypothetical protein